MALHAKADEIFTCTVLPIEQIKPKMLLTEEVSTVVCVLHKGDN